MQHDWATCSLPTPTSSILPSFLAVVLGADVRLGSFLKAFVSLVTRTNVIC